MPFGGGGALHATALARELGMSTIVVPRYPGVLCASGLLSAPIEHEAATGFMARFADADVQDVLRFCAQLAAECAARMREEGVPADAVATTCYADVCYVGQAHHIEVPLATDAPETLVATLYEAFCVLYDQMYGHHTRAPARFVNLRVVQRAPNRAQVPAPRKRSGAVGGAATAQRSRRILLADSEDFVAAQVVDRDGLTAGDTLHGPAIVEQSDTTTLIEPGWIGRVADNEVLILTVAP
jgi:N-methylhydantoinase A/oxoprolinase/acetone carboxylase beta subunit